MDHLAACYASSSPSSGDEDDAAQLPRSHSRTRNGSALDPIAADGGSHDAAAVARPPPDAMAVARAALAQRFAVRAQSASHRATADEHRYAYRPYGRQPTARTVKGAVVALSSQDRQAEKRKGTLLPLFSTVRALAAPRDAYHAPVISASSRQAIALPSWRQGNGIKGHSGSVNCLHWNPRFPPLFLSASMDHTVRVWSLPHEYDDRDDGSVSLQSSDRNQRCRRVLAHHTRGVKSAKWSLDGRHVWSGGYDGVGAYVDVERAAVFQQFSHHVNEHVSTTLPHPVDPQLALFGTDRGRILQRDLRINASSPPSAVYGTKTTGEVHDLLFLPGHDTCFVSSSALTARDTSHQTLLVWDARSSALVADHLNNDLCSFTSLQLHPNHKHFAAQSTTSEIVLFSVHAPYKKLKPTRRFYGSHDVQGFGVGCSFNATGTLLATGDVHGRVVLYDAVTRRILKQYPVYETTTPCLAVAFHPQWASTLVSGGYDGRIELFDTLSHA